MSDPRLPPALMCDALPTKCTGLRKYLTNNKYQSYAHFSSK